MDILCNSIYIVVLSKNTCTLWTTFDQNNCQRITLSNLVVNVNIYVNIFVSSARSSFVNFTISVSFCAISRGFFSRELAIKEEDKEAFEKCRAHSPLRAAARPFTRSRYCRTQQLSHAAACASMSTTTTTTTTTRDRVDRYGPIEWAQWPIVHREWVVRLDLIEDFQLYSS